MPDVLFQGDTPVLASSAAKDVTNSLGQRIGPGGDGADHHRVYASRSRLTWYLGEGYL